MLATLRLDALPELKHQRKLRPVVSVLREGRLQQKSLVDQIMMQAMRDLSNTSILPLLDDSIICCSWGRTREAKTRSLGKKPQNSASAFDASTAVALATTLFP
jgi:hypothetical protein